MKVCRHQHNDNSSHSLKKRVLPDRTIHCGRASSQAMRMVQVFQGPEYRKGSVSMENSSFAVDTLPAVALAVLAPEFLDSAYVRADLLRRLHGDRAACPDCGRDIPTGKGIAAFWEERAVRCGGCGRHFDARTGTMLEGTRLDCRTVFVLALLLGLGLPARQVAARLGLHETTVRDWRDRLSLGSLASIPSIGVGTAARRGRGNGIWS